MQSWTEDEARAYLPRLRTLVAIVRRAAEISAHARGNGHSKAIEEPVVVSEDASSRSAAETGPKEALEELDERGIIVRDPARGLVDFPCTRPSGRVVLLCWQLGEDDLSWWHLPEDGFAGRRPLPVPPEI